jgi:hypothetical protein
MNIRDRLGFDVGAMGLEDALAWAARYGFHDVDFNADQPVLCVPLPLHDGLWLTRR